jgi:hypothetical protein
MKISGIFLFLMLLLAACAPASVPGANPGPATVAPAELVNSQSTSAISAPATSGVCTLVSKDDIGTILGEAVDEVRNPDKKGINCVYQTKSLILELNTLHTFGGSGNSVDYMKQTRVNGVGEPALDVPGLGDEAFYHGGAAYRLLLVRKGDTVYSFGVRSVTADQSLSSPDNAQALEKAVAGLVLSHLP